MAKLNFGGVEENVVTREEFPLAKAQEVLKNEVVAVIMVITIPLLYRRGSLEILPTWLSSQSARIYLHGRIC